MPNLIIIGEGNQGYTVEVVHSASIAAAKRRKQPTLPAVPFLPLPNFLVRVVPSGEDALRLLIDKALLTRLPCPSEEGFEVEAV